MADIFHWWGNDLTFGATGDLLPVDGTVRGEQRVVRRLLTNPAANGVSGDYLWHQDYGCGLPRFVGQPADVPAISALIRSQILMEAAVAPDPAPVITVTPILPSGLYVVIQYVDAPSQEPVLLGFDINA